MSDPDRQLSFEIGPIRPPSEARSLLVRVTRNCPHNRCAFCPVYKGARFSIRPLPEVLQDIRHMARTAEILRERAACTGRSGENGWEVVRAAARDARLSPGAAQVAVFLAAGGEHAFLQDANSLALPAADLRRVIEALIGAFSSLTRITSYARAHTLTRRRPEELAALRHAGLSRVHVGLESGSDRVLRLMRKGVDAERQIQAGLRAKEAGFELSEYLMPGLGGRALWQEHAEQSARVLSAIDPHFIRLRTTAVAPGTELQELAQKGDFQVMTDEETVAEIRLLLEQLEVTSVIQSDHILNLLPEIEGRLPDDRPRLLALIDRFLSMDERPRRAFVLGRRTGLLGCLEEMEQERTREQALALLDHVTGHYGGDLQAAISDLMARFV